MKKSWKTLKKIREYKNPFMEVWKHEVIRSDGNHRPYYILERSINGSLVSIAIPLTEDQCTFLVGQYRYPISFYSWEFHMGHAKGKSFLEVAKTELREETGITATIWQKIGQFFTTPGHSSEKVQIFVAKNLSIFKSSPSEAEILEVKKIPLKKVGELIKKGEILDGLTIVAYHYLELYLSAGRKI